MSESSAMAGPHAAIQASGSREQTALQLFDLLWDDYRRQVPHVAVYERLVREAGAEFVNDHIAFRTLASQSPLTGIATLSRLFEALGYQAAGCYLFPDKHLSAIHFQHPHPQFPKLFISELRLWELAEPAQRAAAESLARHDMTVTAELLRRLHHGPRADEVAELAKQAADCIRRPWPPPQRQAVEAMNAASQYGAWVLVHGYRVNHFTSLINSHGVAELDTIDKTVAALRAAGVPMKDEVEGEAGSRLRQTATAAAVSEVEVTDDQGRSATMPWTYAYFELAERGKLTDPETGRASRFEGFLGPQATQLFEMTRGQPA